MITGGVRIISAEVRGYLVVVYVPLTDVARERMRA
jgi:hypothetical protein